MKMKKQFFRVKQIADQTFLGAEKTEVLTEDLVSAEKRVELIKQSCQNIAKKAAGCLQSGGTDPLGPEKRLKKLKEIVLSQSMLESSGLLGETSILGIIFGKSASLQEKLGKEILEYEISVEEHLLTPIGDFLENDIPNISKLRKHLNKLTLDMDSARSRYQAAVRHSNQQAGGGLNNATAKVDVVKEVLEDASLKVEQCKDTLAAEMFALLKKEPEFAKLFVDWYKFQANYHQKMLNILEECIPLLDSDIRNFNHKSVYGVSLDEHLRVTDREIAFVIEMCVCSLLENGMDEEGLFRIAGSALKAKKLKNSFDAGIIFDLEEYARDPHCVAGALKSYLRELPEPLLTFDLYEEWTNAAKIVDPEARLQALWQVLLRLPETNRNNLRYIIKFLAKLATNSDVNKMSPQNIAIVFAPNLIWGPDQVTMQFSKNMSVANVHSVIVDSLVSHADWFFPGEMQFYVTSPQVSIDSSKILAPANQQKYPTCNGDWDPDHGGSQPNSITTSPIANSPKPTHRPSKKPAPPTPGGQHIENVGISEKTLPPNHKKHFSIHCVPPTSCEKFSKVDLETSSCLQKVVEPSGKPECPFTVQSHENMSGNVINKSHLTRAEKPEKPEKPTKLLLYSTNSLDHKRKSGKGEKPPLAPRHIKLSNHTEKSSVPLPGISPRNHVNPIENLSLAPPEKPSKPEKLAKPIKFSESFKQLSQPEDNKKIPKSSSQKLLVQKTVTKNLAESKVLLVETLGSNEKDKSRRCEHEVEDKSEKLRLFQSQKITCEDLKIDEAISKDMKTTGSGHAFKQNRWSFLTSQSAEKTPDRPPRITPPSNETGNKNRDQTDFPSDSEENKTCVVLSCQKQSPEGSSQSIYVEPEAFVNRSFEKPYCTIIHIGGSDNTKVLSSPSLVRSKPPRPLPPVKPKFNTVSKGSPL